MERTEEAGTEFGVGFEFEVARLVDVGVARAWGIVATGAYGAGREGPDGIGTADVELFAIGRTTTIAVTIDGTGKEAGGQIKARIEATRVAGFKGGFDKLGKGRTEEALVGLSPRAAGDGLNAGEEVARLLDTPLHEQGMRVGRRRAIGQGVADGGDELVAHRHVEGGVGVGDGVEGKGGVHQPVVFDREHREFVLQLRMPTPFVDYIGSCGNDLEEARAVAPIGIERESGASHNGVGVAKPEGLNCGIEGTGFFILPTPLLPLPFAPSAGVPREQQTRIFQVELRAQLKTVEQGVAAVATVAELPLIAAEEFSRYGFAGTESIEFGKFVADTGADLLVALERGVHLKRGVVGAC